MTWEKAAGHLMQRNCPGWFLRCLGGNDAVRIIRYHQQLSSKKGGPHTHTQTPLPSRKRSLISTCFLYSTSRASPALNARSLQYPAVEYELVNRLPTVRPTPSHPQALRVLSALHIVDHLLKAAREGRQIPRPPPLCRCFLQLVRVFGRPLSSET